MMLLPRRWRAVVGVVALTLGASSAQGSADDYVPKLTPASVTYSDGAVAQALPECGAMDLCATVSLPNDDTIRVYNLGSRRCEPFTLHLVTVHFDAVVL